jgi:NAD(P)-dependent dehydrogenase (short-subunit alcohol dehydrogenase family)
MVEADLDTLDVPKTLAAAAGEEFGKVDILVNNAGHSSVCSLSDASDLEI